MSRIRNDEECLHQFEKESNRISKNADHKNLDGKLSE